MTDAVHGRFLDDWPLFGLRVRCEDVALRPVREGDLPHLAAIQPPDYEHDPSAEPLPGLSVDQHRRRLVYQDYWRSMGTWLPSSWTLAFLVEYQNAVVGVQSLEAEDYPTMGTVDSGSWLVPSARGRGIGVAMRGAVLSLAFDHLEALAAVSSARRDNAASLGVSRRLGYRGNGVSLNASGSGLVELEHMRLTKEEWQASGARLPTEVTGLAPCLPWFGLAPAASPSVETSPP